MSPDKVDGPDEKQPDPVVIDEAQIQKSEDHKGPSASHELLTHPSDASTSSHYTQQLQDDKEEEKQTLDNMRYPTLKEPGFP